MSDVRITSAIATAILDDFEGPPAEAELRVYRAVIAMANDVPFHRRPRVAIVVSPEEGVRVVPRGLLAERLRSAGLERQAQAVFRLSVRDDIETIVTWVEGEDADGRAVARLGVLRSPTAIAREAQAVRRNQRPGKTRNKR